jgi:hypothetical protein
MALKTVFAAGIVNDRDGTGKTHIISATVLPKIAAVELKSLPTPQKTYTPISPYWVVPVGRFLSL